MSDELDPACLFGARAVLVLDERRRELGLTEAEFSRQLGHAPGYWRRKMKGHELDFAQFFRASKTVGLPAWMILREVEMRWPA